MPTPLTDAPIQQAISSPLHQAWVTWFQLVQQYIVGFITESTTDATLQVNQSYIPNSISLIVYTAPSRFAVGDTIEIIGKGAGGWQVQLNTGQIIHGTSSTTSGGTLSSANRYNSVILKGITKDTELSVISQVGNPTYA